MAPTEDCESAYRNSLSGFVLNEYGQQVGRPVPKADIALPSHMPMDGRYCLLERVSVVAHAERLYQEVCVKSGDQLWTYMPFGPFASCDDLSATLAMYEEWESFLGFAICDRSGQPRGFAAYLRADVLARSIEVGGIVYGPSLQRTTGATEAMFLMAKRAFDSGFRRYEWKCDALNIPSGKAAERLGFTYEGTFRQAGIYKGRNRDTSWYSMIDVEWPAIRDSFLAWLDPTNFDADGEQRKGLSQIRTGLTNEDLA